MNMLCVLLVSLAASMAAEEVALQEFTTGSNLFTAAIYRELATEQDGNFLISPFSLQTVLALTQSGAREETAAELRAGLHLPNNTEAIEATYRALLPRLRGNENYALNTANRIYVKQNFALNETFRKTAQDVFQAGVEPINFEQKSDAANTINNWVEQQTNNKIRQLIDPQSLDELTRVILINALYFKGKWQVPFETFSTFKKDFFTNARDTVQVDTMHNTDTYNYYESEELDAKFLELPYQGGEVSFIIVLPNQRDGLRNLESKIDRVFTRPKFTLERVSVALPRFTVETTTRFPEILKKLGISRIFDASQVDLSGIAGKKGDLVVSEVIQKAFINVTEAGTEAAAASAVKLRTRIAHVYASAGPIKIFRADHPFVFYICAVEEVVLFQGRFNANI